MSAIQSVFRPLSGVLPQLCSFSGVGPTVYALVVRQDAVAALYGPAIDARGLASWPAPARGPAAALLQGRSQSQSPGEIVVIALVLDACACARATPHCVAIRIPAPETGCDPSTPNACAANVLGP
jgi:hypothetical protein